MKVIGLTGGIASGKSTVSSLLKKYGFAVVDADIASREAVAPGSIGLQQVSEAFGEKTVINGEMNRAYIGQLVFKDQEKREILNRIIHPIVRELMEQQKQQALLKGQHVIMDIPLLYENGLEQTVDEVWVVYVPQEVQLTRLMERNQLTEEEAAARINSQLPIEQKKQRADRVIDNSGTLQQLEVQVQLLTEEFFRNNLKIEKI